MRNKFVADGCHRFMRAKKNVASPESIAMKYAAELACARSDQQAEIRGRRERELLRRQKTASHQPSAGTFW
jgi:hypothetical protein